MNLRSVPAAPIGLLVCLSIPVQAQEEKRSQPPKPSLDALRSVQKALHAAEEAQLKLLATGPRQGAAFAAVKRAVRELTAARKALRARLAGDVAREGREKPERLDPTRAAKPAAKSPKPDPQVIHLAIERGLRWLHTHQDQDGKWDADGFVKHDRRGRADGAGNPVHDVGITGLALLAFLGDGSTTKKGPYKEVVQKAVAWLRTQQGRNGLFGTRASHDFIYDHAIASFAMCEAYGLSKDETLKASAQEGINYLESHRNPYAVWRYQPRDNDNDISVTNWCVLAYRSATDFKLKTKPVVLKIAANYLDELTDPVTGRTGYTRRGEGSSRHPGRHAVKFPSDKSETLTAVGLASRFVLGQSPERTQVMKIAARTMLAKLPSAKDKASIDHYYWFHGTRAMGQMGGRYWDAWSRALGRAVLETQRNDENRAVRGSWDSNGVWGEDGGRIYSTSLMLMTLQAAHRRLTLVR